MEITTSFRYFISKLYPNIPKVYTEIEIDEIGIEFNKYLNMKLNDRQKSEIIPSKNVVDILLKSTSPLTVHGFHPAYVMHFQEWVEKMSKEQQ